MTRAPVISSAVPIRGAGNEKVGMGGIGRAGGRQSTLTMVEPRSTLGSFPLMAVFAATGLAIVALGDGLSRSTRSSSQVPFWVGMFVIFVPIAFRLASRETRRGERLALVVILGMSLYLVKVMHSPFDFLFADELVHVHNANEIMRTHHLFSDNSILSVTPYYPGLQSVTAALSTLSGIGMFGCGVIVLGAARLAMMLGLFLFFERVSGSAHVAGIAAAVYCANSNFVFFNAQFAYESLALPLLVFGLMCLAERAAASPAEKAAWTLPIVLSIGAVVVTHHLTSYALAILLSLYAGIGFLLRRRTGDAGPWPYAVLAIGAAIAWLVLVASSTVGYLTPVISGAFTDTFHTLTGESAPRQLFSSSAGSGGYRIASIERIVGLGSVVLIAIAYPVGVMVTWRRVRNNALGILLLISSAFFFLVLGLRFAPGAWETANRSQEFLFIGLAFVLGFVGLELFEPVRARWLGRALTAGSLAVIFAGGIIVGWTPDFRLPRPYEVSAEGHVIHPEGVELASWAASLPAGSRFAATDADARLLIAKSDSVALTGGYPDVNDILKSTDLPAWQLSLLRDYRLRYVAVDRRVRSFDNMEGYYFGLLPATGLADELLPAAVAGKFDRLHVSKLYSSGTITVYDLEPTFDAEAKR